ncbi:hypothetical protein CLOLEP_00913 [[Clostridium] leptum DSM 753]|uniref:Uncharacterized protein n=1 Tax=[Clostridium] leptum DSM 753 TaxID=428125 RepID=A7VQT1_9FIRM|nr:hypothetical protein CLOLEP_00913 [[Clostridium] leptum DSM 753]
MQRPAARAEREALKEKQYEKDATDIPYLQRLCCLHVAL